MASTAKAVEQLQKLVDLFSKEEMVVEHLSAAYLKKIGNRPSDSWSFANKVLMLMSGTNDARGYRQWQSVGRQVCKGSKAIYILGPSMRKVKETETAPDGTTKEIETERCVGFRAIPVFKHEDTAGKELDPIVEEPAEQPPLVDVAKAWGVDVKYDLATHGELGWFSQTAKAIRICVDGKDAAPVFFHELAHAAHARLETLKGGQDAKQEAIAQLSACVLGKMYGYDIQNKTYHYIAGYAGGSDPDKVGKLCQQVLHKTGQVLTTILDAATKATPGESESAASTKATPGESESAASTKATPGESESAASTKATPGES